MEYDSFLEEVIEFSKSHYDKYDHGGSDVDYWDNHIMLVVKYAKILAEHEGVNPKILEVAAYLHDIGKHIDKENHHVVGYDLSKEFLEKYNLESEFKEKVLKCIFKHRTRFSHDDNILEVKIIQSADALALFFDMEWQRYCRKKMCSEDLSNKLMTALDKITIPYAKELAEEQIKKIIAELT